MNCHASLSFSGGGIAASSNILSCQSASAKFEYADRPRCAIKRSDAALKIPALESQTRSR